jgi:hypothetical protein
VDAEESSSSTADVRPAHRQLRRHTTPCNPKFTLRGIGSHTDTTRQQEPLSWTRAGNAGRRTTSRAPPARP